MGYLFRVRMASFFAGAAVASGFGFYFLYKDYMIAQEAISQQAKSVYNSLDARVAALESLNKVETAPPLEASE
ncbi:ABC transporter A family protein [Wolffia australiana]